MSEALIAGLARDIRPVRRLRPAWQRAGGGLLLALAAAAALAVWHGPRPNLADALASPGFIWRLAGAAFTAVFGALAAAQLSVPGRSPLWLAAPMAGICVWVAGIGHGCASAWVVLLPGMLAPEEAASCLLTVVLTGLVAIAAMTVMLRRGAPQRLVPASLAAGLAAAGCAGATLTLLHPIDASAMVLAWNIGAMLLLVGVELLVGTRLLRLRAAGAPR